MTDNLPQVACLIPRVHYGALNKAMVMHDRELNSRSS